MSESVLASAPPTNGPRPFPRAYWPWLVLLLAIHGAVLIWAVSQAWVTPPTYWRPEGFLGVTLAALACFGAAFAARGRYTRAIAWNGAILVASALLTPAVVLVVLLQLLNAFVLGVSVLALVKAQGDNPETQHFAVATLTGVAIWIGITAAAAPFKVHYLPVYAAALLLPLLFWWRTAAGALLAAGRMLVQRGPPLCASERAWTALLMTMVVLHLFVVAKPEVGYDALAMHLQIPVLMAETHKWTFDVTRYLWAVMPIGADWTFTAAYLLGGEGAARFLNFTFAAIAGFLLFELIRRYARRDVALAGVCLFASMPLAFLETSTLYVENLWMAFLLGTLLLALDHLRGHSRVTLVALAFLAAGAMQCKVIGVIWLTPLLAWTAWLVWQRGSHRDFAARDLALLAAAVAIAAWPYANAWLRTGNPVFPFMNALFKSPLFDATASFNNALYNAPLRPWSVYELVWSSGRFIEGFDGAAGFHWLLLFPVILLTFLRRPPRAYWLCLALAAIAFVGVFTQQSYLRYLLPVFALIAVLGGWALAEIPDGRATRTAMLVIGCALCLVNVRLMWTGSWANLTLCTACGVDNRARHEFVAQWGPDRLAADYLNRNLPNARVGFYMLGGSPAGFVGYSRAGNWHDDPTYRALVYAESADDVLAHARAYRLTHIVYRDPPYETENEAMRTFRERYTVPIWRESGLVIATIAAMAK
jgi:hypothetical protein